MKYRLLVLVCWLFAFTFSCRHQVQNEMIPLARHLVADTLCNSPFFFTGTTILKNSHIFMIDPFSAGEMDIYNTKTGQMDSIRTLHPNYYTKNDGTNYPDALLQQLPISFYHSHMASYYTYTLENDRVKLYRQKLRAYINRAEQINENMYVTLGAFRTGLLGLFDNKSKVIEFYGHYPLPVDIPFEKNAMRKIVQDFQGNITYSNQHSKVLYASRKFAYLSCYHFTGKKLKFQWEKHIAPPPAYTIVNGLLEFDKTAARGGFSDVAIAGDYIFACYAQKNITDSTPDTTYSILVYDMTGNHVATFHIDSSISSMVVDAEEGAIYGISREIEPVIVRFKFDKI
jgi:hypothetical protein